MAAGEEQPPDWIELEPHLTVSARIQGLELEITDCVLLRLALEATCRGRLQQGRLKVNILTVREHTEIKEPLKRVETKEELAAILGHTARVIESEVRSEDVALLWVILC